MNETPLNHSEDVVSATECTGLVPALPHDDVQADKNLADLFAVLPPKKRNSHKKKHK